MLEYVIDNIDIFPPLTISSAIDFLSGISEGGINLPLESQYVSQASRL